MVIDQRRGNVLGLVAPNFRHGWSIFKACDDIFIPYENICKIGDDVILVELFSDSNSSGRDNCKNNKRGTRCQSTSTEQVAQEDGEKFEDSTIYGSKIK